MASHRLRLRIELIPKPLWQLNLRQPGALGKYRWDKLRREIEKKDGARCTICGATDRKLHGHEAWNYREKKTVGTALLLRVEIVCTDCHDIHHWGRTTKLYQDGVISAARYGHLRKHFRRVNRCTQEMFDRHFQQSARIWMQRSKKKWKIDWGGFVPAVTAAKAARAAWAERNPDHGNFNVMPAHHIPDRCPKCGAVGRLVPLDANRNEMSEGQEADYDAGLWGFAVCRACKSDVIWQG